MGPSDLAAVELHFERELHKAHQLIKRDHMDDAVKQLQAACNAALDVAKRDFARYQSSVCQEKVWREIGLVNAAFRTQLAKLQSEKRLVERRKQCRKYLDFLVHAQNHFFDLVCALVSNPSKGHELVEILLQHRQFEGRLHSQENENCQAETNKLVRRACYEACIHLGDLSRYRESIRDGPKRLMFALEWHAIAIEILPSRGSAYHQRAMVYNQSQSVEHQLRAVNDLCCAAQATQQSGAETTATLRTLIKNLGWQKLALKTCNADEVHPVLRLDDPNWSQNVIEGSVFNEPFSKSGFLIDRDGVKAVPAG